MYKWLLTFLGFPLGGYTAYLIVGSVTNLLTSLFAGLIVGLFVGTAQWLVLRKVIPLSKKWIPYSGIGVALGLLIGALIIGTGIEHSEIIFRGAITGISLGFMQWLLLKQHVRLSGVWIIVLPLFWSLAWLTTISVGINLSNGWAVFGSSGAILFAILTYLVLRFIHRVRF